MMSASHDSVVVDAGSEVVASVERSLREGAREVVIESNGDVIDVAVLHQLRRFRGVRLRVSVSTFDADLQTRLGAQPHPSEIVRGIARASEAGLVVDVVLPLAAGLGPAAGRLHGLSRVAPRVARYLLAPVAEGAALPPLTPPQLASEIREACDAARELGVRIEIEERVDASHQLLQALERLAARDLLGGLIAFRAAETRAVDPKLLELVRPLFASLMGRGPRDAAATPKPPEEPRSEAWALLWAGDVQAVRTLCEGGSPDTSALLGVALVLERRAAEALPLLARALAERADPNVALHRVHALLHLDRVREAERALADLVDGESFGCRILHALASLRSIRGGRRTVGRWVARARESHTRFNGLFATELPALLGREALDEACRSHAAIHALLEGLLHRMAGNLGPSPTFAEHTGSARRFVRIDLPPTSRAAATEALFSIRYGGVAGAEEALARVLARYPRSVHAHTYRGELDLWIGRYADAARSFVRAAAIEPTRWAEIGLVAAAASSGWNRTARVVAWIAAHHFPEVAGGTLPVYRGALRRSVGDPRAIDDLSKAVAAKPTRVGARIELVLALRANQRDSEALPHVEQLLLDAPGLLVDSAEALGIDWLDRHEALGRSEVLEAALRAMRGNRSSAIVTWFDRAGELRILDSPQLLAAKASQKLQRIRKP